MVMGGVGGFRSAFFTALQTSNPSHRPPALLGILFLGVFFGDVFLVAVFPALVAGFLVIGVLVVLVVLVVLIFAFDLVLGVSGISLSAPPLSIGGVAEIPVRVSRPGLVLLRVTAITIFSSAL